MHFSNMLYRAAHLCDLQEVKLFLSSSNNFILFSITFISLGYRAASPHRLVWCLVRGASDSAGIPWQHYYVRQVLSSCKKYFDIYSRLFLALPLS